MRKSGLGAGIGLAVGASLAMTMSVAAQSHSKYAGQEQRSIKSLSADDIAELKRGGGWGFAKIAELNGVPGPIHLLEMKDEVGLTADQVARIQTVYQTMRAKAQALGRKFIALERELDDRFRTGTIAKPSLQDLLARSARVRMQLRETHLSAHLRVLPIVSRGQVEKYNRLRGYSASDRCASVPQGHDAAMWRKHHGCD